MFILHISFALFYQNQIDKVSLLTAKRDSRGVVRAGRETTSKITLLIFEPGINVAFCLNQFRF